MARRDAGPVKPKLGAQAVLAKRLRASLLAQVDIASLAAFRVLFGLVMAGSALRFLAKGWVEQFFLRPAHHFTYAGFSCVQPWPGHGMVLHFLFLFLCALGMAAGCWYRICSVGFCLGFTYVELLERSLYLNHYYLVSLLAALLCVLPAERAFSIDAWRRPALRRDTLPNFALAVLRLQVALVYFFAGVAKLNHDWLGEAQPLRIWLAARGTGPLVGSWLALPEVAYLASWVGCAFDLTIVGFLWWRRTRGVAFVALIAFHLLTALLFPLGIFPWLMIAAATVLLSPAWPRRVGAVLGRSLGALRTLAPTPHHGPWRSPRWLAPLLTAHALGQVLVPVVQHLKGGNSAWTFDGFNFAWNVMVAEKAGVVSFRARERGSSESVRVEPSAFLAPFQATAMAQDPELVRQAALIVAESFRRRGRDVAVYADAFASLNGRPERALIDPAVDLTRALPPQWIQPLE